MSEHVIIKARLLPDGTVVQLTQDGSVLPLVDKTDWQRVKNMTEEEIEAGALSDPDNPPLSDRELKRFRPMPRLKEIRKRLHMTQEQFADNFSLPLGTVRDWEQGIKQPDTAARVLLYVIAKNPAAVLQALQEPL